MDETCAWCHYPEDKHLDEGACVVWDYRVTLGPGRSVRHVVYDEAGPVLILDTPDGEDAPEAAQTIDKLVNAHNKAVKALMREHR